MMIKFVTYSTPDYGTCAKRLDATMHRYELDYTRTRIPDHGGWRANVLYRAQFLLGMWDKYHSEYDAMVWIDADGLLLHYPELFFSISTNLAWHTRNGMPMAGTLFFALNKRVRRFLVAWTKHSEILAQTKTPDQRALRAAHKELPLSHLELPLVYCNFWHPEEDHRALVVAHFRWRGTGIR